jgi:hypothetical protein
MKNFLGQEKVIPLHRSRPQDLITGDMSTLPSGLALRCPASLLIPGHTSLRPFLPHDHPHSEDIGDSDHRDYYPRSLPGIAFIE